MERSFHCCFQYDCHTTTSLYDNTVATWATVPCLPRETRVDFRVIPRRIVRVLPRSPCFRAIKCLARGHWDKAKPPHFPPINQVSSEQPFHCLFWLQNCFFERLEDQPLLYNTDWASVSCPMTWRCRGPEIVHPVNYSGYDSVVQSSRCHRPYLLFKTDLAPPYSAAMENPQVYANKFKTPLPDALCFIQWRPVAMSRKIPWF